MAQIGTHIRTIRVADPQKAPAITPQPGPAPVREPVEVGSR